jgi:5-methylcytosine-specific restriction protein A
MFNFQDDNGMCYGYATPGSKVNLSRISKNISHDALGDYIDDVCVIFTCSRESGGRVVCGFYQHARVYATPVNDERAARKFVQDGSAAIASYNLVCDMLDAVLINTEHRMKILPRARDKNSAGHGRHPLWYADDLKSQKMKNTILDYIESILNDRNISNDELRFDESKSHIASTRQIYRNQAARNACVRLKGCHCNICGFDFKKIYGELGEDYIEVHHITPIGKLSTAAGYEGTDPEKDLIPLCSNCHSMVHRKKEPYHPDKIRKILGK